MNDRSSEIYKGFGQSNCRHFGNYISQLFRKDLVASNSELHGCWHFGNVSLPIVRNIVCANLSEIYHCRSFVKLSLPVFRKVKLLSFRKLIIINTSELGSISEIYNCW